MLASLMKSLFPVVPAEFVSRYSLPESIVRLRDAAEPATPFTLKQKLTCTFTGTAVELARMIPFAGNQAAPIFAGSFHNDARGVVLSGQFKSRKLFIFQQYAMFLFFALMAAVCVPFVFVHPWKTLLALLFPMGLLATFYFNLRACQWFARNDVAWLSRAIGCAISDPAEWPEPPPQPPGWLRRKFIALSGQ